MNMSDAIYRGYDREALDAQYFLRPQVEDFPAFVELYQQLSKEARDEFNCKLDIAYGEKPGEKLDVFTPDGAANAPVHFFIHGGYWQSMDKSDFDYVAKGLVPRGAVTVVVNYTLAPEVHIDEIVRQNRAALAWTWKNIAQFGGDPANIHVSGHSAGGHLTAMMAATDWQAFEAGLPANLVKSGLPISGVFELEPVRMSFLNDVLALDEAEALRNSPALLTAPGPMPYVLTLGGDETVEFHRQTNDYAQTLKDQGSQVEVIIPDGLNHFTIVEEYRDPQSNLSNIACRLMGLG
jgi:arylformamidase